MSTFHVIASVCWIPCDMYFDCIMFTEDGIANYSQHRLCCLTTVWNAIYVYSSSTDSDISDNQIGFWVRLLFDMHSYVFINIINRTIPGKSCDIKMQNYNISEKESIYPPFSANPPFLKIQKVYNVGTVLKLLLVKQDGSKIGH